MKKKIIASLLLLLFLLVNLSPTFASEEKEVYAWEDEVSGVMGITDMGERLSGISKVIDSGTITVNGVKNPLYVTFEDSGDAIEGLKKTIPGLLAVLQADYELEELSADNWKDYMSAMYRYIEWPDDSKKSQNSNDLNTLQCFFDIYENYECNEEILAYVANNKELKADDLDLVLLLPSFAPYSKTYDEKYRAEKSLGIGLNNAAMFTAPDNMIAALNTMTGINYANQYATTPNYSNYEYFVYDCTNFVSQILYAAGQPQYVYSSEYSGWWHKKTAQTPGGFYHTHSVSWVRADTFVKYWGTDGTTSGIRYLTSYLQAGDFIALDYLNDGSWDHNGYCTNKNYALTTVNGHTFYNTRVAQHSRNYHDWMNAGAIGWANAEGDFPTTGTYHCRYAYLRWH